MDDCALPVINTGLRGIDIASSKICDVQGKEGKLIYRGFLVEDLAKNASFEEVCFLLLHERLPKENELENFEQSLKQKRNVPENIFSFLKTLSFDSNPMDVLQMAIPLLIQNDETIGEQEGEKKIESALYSAENLIAGIATITAAWDRIRNKKEIILPDNNLNHAANFLYMLNGEKPDDETARFFDTSLVLHAEHSFNASTFTARQVASTRAHIYAAISAAIIRATSAFLGKPLEDEAVNRITYEVEKIHHGNPSGIDNTVITYQQPVFYVKDQPIEMIDLQHSFAFVIADTGEKSSTAVTVGDVRTAWQENPEEFDALFKACGQITLKAKLLLNSGEKEELGKLMSENHALLQKMGVSSPELDKLSTAAINSGAYGAKLSGGGRGGIMIALTPDENTEEISNALITAGAVNTIITRLGAKNE